MPSPANLSPTFWASGFRWEAPRQVPAAADLPSGAERGGRSPGRWAVDWVVLFSEAFLGFGPHHAARLPSLCFPLSLSLCSLPLGW